MNPHLVIAKVDQDKLIDGDSGIKEKYNNDSELSKAGELMSM